MNKVNIMKEKISLISIRSTKKTQPCTPVRLILEDKVLIVKNEIAIESERIVGQEIGKQQSSTTACEVLKKELSEVAHTKAVSFNRSESKVTNKAKQAVQEATWFEQ
jgi:hypothetical protein